VVWSGLLPSSRQLVLSPPAGYRASDFVLWHERDPPVALNNVSTSRNNGHTGATRGSPPSVPACRGPGASQERLRRSGGCARS
jgi:hypothetical protein